MTPRLHITGRHITDGLALGLALALSAGCIDTNFPPPSRVQTPRILAMVSSHPEPAPGEDVVLSALVVDEDGSPLDPSVEGVEFRWTICLTLREIFGAAGQAAPSSETPDDCVDAASGLVTLAETDEGLWPGAAFLPGALTELLADELERALPIVSGADAQSAMLIQLLLDEIGLPLIVRLQVRRAGEPDPVLRGLKRFALTRRENPTTNPPPPRFAIAGRWVSAREGDDPTRCVTEDGGERPSVEAGAEIELEPDPDEDAWLETYPVFGLVQGEVIENRESAYYSWFSTGGRFASQITRRPERDNTWTAPEAPGTYPLWLVVRDGHLGVSACETEVDVR